MENKNLIDFLKKEYEITLDSWKFIHEDRSKYVAIFVSLIAGTGYAFIKGVDACNWPIAISIALFSGAINIFFLRWFIAQRASALRYIDRLIRIRSKLCDLSGGDREIREIILNTNPIHTEKIPYSSELEFYPIIILLIVLNFSAAIYIGIVKYLRIDNWVGYLLILIFIILLYWGAKNLSDKYLIALSKKALEILADETARSV